MSQKHYKNISHMTKQMPTGDTIIKIKMVDIKEIKSKTITTDIIDDVSAFLDITTEFNGLTPQNIILVVTQMMAIVAKYKKLSGADKKKIVLTLLKNKIVELEIDDDIKQTLLIMADEVIPSTIDVLVEISKGRYKFKYIPKIFKVIKKLCCKCC